VVTLETVRDVPSVEDWTRMVQTATPAEAVKLWQLSIECLEVTKGQDQGGWGTRIGIAERVLGERGISWH
jgi:hypothetical protein